MANKLLKQRLAKHGYNKLKHTPGLFKHGTRPISFTLVVDDFGIKYEGAEHLKHLLDILKSFYNVEVDMIGGLYCGITLDWNYQAKYATSNEISPDLTPHMTAGCFPGST